MGKLFPFPCYAVDKIKGTRRAILAAVQTPGGKFLPVTQTVDRHPFTAHFVLPFDAASSPEQARTAGIFPEIVFLDQDIRIFDLRRLDRHIGRICQVDLHAAQSVKLVACPGTARYRLMTDEIVSAGFFSTSEDHACRAGAVGRSKDPFAHHTGKGSEDRIRNALRRVDEDADRPGFFRIHDASLGRDDGDRAEDARIRREARAHKGLDRIQDR